MSELLCPQCCAGLWASSRAPFQRGRAAGLAPGAKKGKEQCGAESCRGWQVLVARCHEGLPSPSMGKDGNPTNPSLWEDTSKENTCFLKGCPIRQMGSIPLFPVRTGKKDPIVDSPVLFTACTIMGVLQRRAHSRTSSL